MDELGLWIGVIALKLEAELRAIGEAAASLGSALIVLDGPPLHRRLHGDRPLRRGSLSLLAAQGHLDAIRDFALTRGWHLRDPHDGEDGTLRFELGRLTLDLRAQAAVPGLGGPERTRLTEALAATEIGAGEGLRLPAVEPLLVYLAACDASDDRRADIQACARHVGDWEHVERISADLGLPPQALGGGEDGEADLDALQAASPAGDDAPLESFRGLEFLTHPGVFPPRAISERLLDLATKVIGDQPDPVAVDVGTGSGAIALALAAERPDAEVWALDSSAKAMSLCRRNADRFDLANVHFGTGHLLEPLSDSLIGRVSLILSNVPYVPPLLPGAERERYPAGTVVGPGQDGLGLVLELARGARDFIGPGGTLLLQVLDLQVERVSKHLAGFGYNTESPAGLAAASASPVVLAAKWRADS